MWIACFAAKLRSNCIGKKEKNEIIKINQNTIKSRITIEEIFNVLV